MENFDASEKGPSGCTHTITVTGEDEYRFMNVARLSKANEQWNGKRK